MLTLAHGRHDDVLVDIGGRCWLVDFVDLKIFTFFKFTENMCKVVNLFTDAVSLKWKESVLVSRDIGTSSCPISVHKQEALVFFCPVFPAPYKSIWSDFLRLNPSVSWMMVCECVLSWLGLCTWRQRPDKGCGLCVIYYWAANAALWLMDGCRQFTAAADNTAWTSRLLYAHRG